MSTSIKNIYQLFVVFTIMGITGLIALILRILTFGLILNFNRKYFIAYSSRFTMFLVGIKLVLPKQNPIGSANYFITFNHNSYLDIFALTSLGYTNTFFLLSEKTLKIIPLTLSALSIGTRYIPQKKHKERRMRFFNKIEKVIIQNKLNVAGASEGVHEFVHGIEAFNKGVYHMAKICNLDVIPLFINVPKESNPFNKYKHFKRGVIQIEVMSTVSTKNWVLENLDFHVEQMRELFVKKFNECHQEKIS